MTSVSKRLSEVFNQSMEIPIDNDSKIILMSDCHRGDGTWSDDFLKNKNIYIAALNHYFDNGYTYIEIGDGDELWENPNTEDIIKEHLDVFMVLVKFYKINRLYLMYGNHDMCKKDGDFLKHKYYSYYDIDQNENISLFNNIKVHEGLILKHKEGYKIFLVHGHQGSFLNDKSWKIGRFFVRNIWRPLELFGIKDPTSAAKNYHIRNKIEKEILEWSNKEKQMIVVGHTHRPVFPDKSEHSYFNTGSCVHPKGITGIEISNGNISLIKWSIKINKDGFLYVDKDIIEGPKLLKDYAEINDNEQYIKTYSK